MSPSIFADFVEQTMLQFARCSGIGEGGMVPRRYLWTDAFAVCNFIGLFRTTGDNAWLDLALQLVDQVHHTLGRHRADDSRSGWISGLSEDQGCLHPTRGGLRIGKGLPERRLVEPFNERREWDRDGQYFHYLTKWMHALLRVSCATGDWRYVGWALELAQTAHARFSYAPVTGGSKRLYWKMSIDLTRPLVPSMGQHDPLDGLVTYSEIQAAVKACDQLLPCGLQAEIDEMKAICRGIGLATGDPLGIGGLLCDVVRIVPLMVRGEFSDTDLLEEIVAAAGQGLEAYLAVRPLDTSACYRLAFRELGLSIGLRGLERMPAWLKEHPTVFEHKSTLSTRITELIGYLPLAEKIEDFWLDGANREVDSWCEHREINMVMLATSLAPGEFLTV